ncbi:acylphosphatase [Pantanalinema sp. GBBB05]|uniref:acylphosphatase n=1 Tax=Pantanalinema sp. GBBB05 TaxID=2604139 RepID=UPI001D9CA8AC|nr:acylphosphatase [Pantanalinema sp. GBBB05]
MADKIRVHVIISGQVQRVGFRYSTQDMAMVYGLNGWVRNLPDGRVEAAFEGDRATIDKMLRWCHKGPPAAVVKQVEVKYEEPLNLQEFLILR